MLVIPDFYNKFKYNYDTSLENVRPGCIFPSLEVQRRNRVYRFNKKLISGEYAKDKMLAANVDGRLTELVYKTIPINYFKLTTDKMMSLMTSNEITISTGDIERDRRINKLINSTRWASSIRDAIRIVEIHGDCILKTGINGASACEPTLGYKVVDSGDVNSTNAFVLHELLYDKDEIPRHIRIIIACRGFEYERVYEYKGDSKAGVLGRPVRYKYKDRWIPKKGRSYETGIDENTVSWLRLNKDGAYGVSPYRNIQDVVFAIEERLSTERAVIDAHGAPLLLVGMSMLKTDELTGEYKLSVIDGMYMVSRGGDEIEPKYLTWDGKLDNSKILRDDLLDELYELSEMGRSFLSGEYSGNISEESLNNIIKTAIDRANRELNDIWYEIQQSLYVLCRLNGIDVELADINISFNVGRVDDNNKIAEVCETLNEIGLFSKRTLLQKFWGYNDQDSEMELNRVKEESRDDITRQD